MLPLRARVDLRVMATKEYSNLSKAPGASQSDCLMLYLGYLLSKSYPSAEMQSMYSTAPFTA